MGDLPEHLQHASFVRTGDKKTGGPNLRIYRLEQNVPALTVTAYVFNKFVHPVEHRYITPREAACLQDFPVDWEFRGTLGQIHKQIGNAVPVKMAHAVASSVGLALESWKRMGRIKVASYFTGAGGLDLGFESASNSRVYFDTVFSTDIEEWAEDTIRTNRPQWNFHRRDIRKLNPEEVLHSIGERPDVIIGGPPCQPFSVAGKQEATNNPLGRLYSDFVRHVDYLRPKLVVMENVYGITQVKSVNMMQVIRKTFGDIGYHISHKELLAADYGTPQMRRRVFFVASLEERGYRFPEPTHSPAPNLLGLPEYIGAGMAISQLPSPEIPI